MYRWFKIQADRTTECHPDHGFIPGGVLVTYDPMNDCFNVYFSAGTVGSHDAFQALVSSHAETLKRTIARRQSGQDPGQG